MSEQDKNRALYEPMIFEDPKNIKTPEQSGLINPMEFDVRDKSFEEKLYIILYKINDDDVDELRSHCFAVCIGRTEAYNNIKDKLISGIDVDVHRSKIITETKQTETKTGDKKYYLMPYEECISLYAFCINVQPYYSDDEFDIEEFNNSEVPEKDELESNPRYLTPEQQDYRKMIDAAIHRDQFMEELRKETGKGVNI